MSTNGKSTRWEIAWSACGTTFTSRAWTKPVSSAACISLPACHRPSPRIVRGGALVPQTKGRPGCGSAGAHVRRQGEWFAIPTKLLTSQLLRDVERGVAVRREQHILGRDGHHRLEEAVIYRTGPRKGEVFARGVMRPPETSMCLWILDSVGTRSCITCKVLRTA